MDLKISMMQMSVALGNKEANKDTILRLGESIPSDCDYLVLPELWNIGYAGNKISENAESMKGDSISFLRRFAKEHHLNIIGGSIAEKHEIGMFNTLPVIDRDGNLIYKYRKVHLFPLGINEPAFFQSGDDWGVFTHEELSFGLMLCYDLRFPAFCRNIALRGGSVIFVPAQWPKERQNHFRVLLQARAIENQVYVVGVNCCGGNRNSYIGGSMVIAPDGTVLMECDSDEGVFSCMIQPTENLSLRKRIPVFQDRRNILDEIDDNLF